MFLQGRNFTVCPRALLELQLNSGIESKINTIVKRNTRKTHIKYI